MRIALEPAGLRVGGELVAFGARDAVHQLRELLGPEYAQRHVGVGSGRTGHWLESGVFVVSQLAETDLVYVDICFDASVATFNSVIEMRAPYVGEIVAFGRTFRGGEREREIRSLAGIEGLAGMLHVRDGDLYVGLDLPRAVGKWGKRTGARRLARISASWGGVRPFPG